MAIVTADSDSNLFLNKNDESRKWLAYDGLSKILYIEETSHTKIPVMEFMDKLDRLKYTYEVESVTFDFIQNLYSEGQTDNRDHSKVQNYAMELIKNAVKQHASDIHIVVDFKKTTIKYRSIGRLTYLKGSNDYNFGVDLCRTIYGTMTDNSDTYFKENLKQDARLSVNFVEDCGLHGGRIATTPTDSGVLMVIRLFYSSADVEPDLAILGYNDEQVSVLKNLLLKSSGILVLSGITGSGKTTSLEKMMKIMIAQSQGRKHFLTIENPPENAIPGANQTPILCEDFNDDSQLSMAWSKSLSNSLRLDPDVIMVGEVRDLNSGKAATQAGRTGHLVLTTVHAFDAVSILDRLIYDMELAPSQLLNHRLVIGLVNQSLVPILCEECKVPYLGNEKTIPVGVQERLHAILPTDEEKKSVFLTGRGCQCCNHEGLTGRAIVAEVIKPDKGFMEAYRDKGAIHAREYWINELNGKTKLNHLIERIKAGEVDPQVAEETMGPLDDIE